MGMNDINSLSHTKWNCKYHIVFAPKYRRKVFYREKRTAIGKILRQLCEWKGVKIIEAEACPDHIHLFVEIPPKMSVSSFMGYLKGKSSTMLYGQFGELKYKFRNVMFTVRTDLPSAKFINWMIQFGVESRILAPKEAIGEWVQFLNDKMRPYGYGTPDYLKDVPTSYDEMRAQKYRIR